MIPIITPEGVGDTGPSGRYRRMSIGDGEWAMVWVGESESVEA